MFSVEGRIAVVTGGLGQLGTQFSKSLAEAGAKVAIFSRRPFSEAQIAEKFPGLEDRIKVYEASVTDKAALQVATDQLIADWGVPHVLVNNAGIDSKPDGGADQNAPSRTIRRNIGTRSSMPT
nr:SDR family NAD(P)-dependent oxidoreductase [Marinicella sp. W31]MDC2875876.1 SDR family NAD(P)-dependent oxidoreductase [Marinicella sp. W31]